MISRAPETAEPAIPGAETTASSWTRYHGWSSDFSASDRSAVIASQIPRSLALVTHHGAKVVQVGGGGYLYRLGLVLVRLRHAVGKLNALRQLLLLPRQTTRQLVGGRLT
eukprot:747711-Hanusia_phi.AAC.4